MDINVAKEKSRTAVEYVLEGIVDSSCDMCDDSTLNDLGLDSLDMVELSMDIEDELNIFIPDDLISPDSTVSEAIDIVANVLVKSR